MNPRYARSTSGDHATCMTASGARSRTSAPGLVAALRRRAGALHQGPASPRRRAAPSPRTTGRRRGGQCWISTRAVRVRVTPAAARGLLLDLEPGAGGIIGVLRGWTVAMISAVCRCLVGRSTSATCRGDRGRLTRCAQRVAGRGWRPWTAGDSLPRPASRGLSTDGPCQGRRRSGASLSAGWAWWPRPTCSSGRAAQPTRRRGRWRSGVTNRPRRCGDGPEVLKAASARVDNHEGSSPLLCTS
jgi:hypothetical protein